MPQKNAWIHVTATVFVLLMVLSAGCASYVTKNSWYNVSDVCDRLFAFQGNQCVLTRTGGDKEPTVMTNDCFNYVDGVVVFSEYNSSKNVGLIVITGRKQIENNETESKYIAISVGDPGQIKAFNAGSVVALTSPGLNWKKQYSQGKEFWFIDNPGANLKKTGEISVDDPLFEDVQRAIREFKDDQNNQRNMQFLLLVYILYFNPASPLSPFYGFNDYD
jgi:hypothetical protein